MRNEAVRLRAQDLLPVPGAVSNFKFEKYQGPAKVDKDMFNHLGVKTGVQFIWTLRHFAKYNDVYVRKLILDAKYTTQRVIRNEDLPMSIYLKDVDRVYRTFRRYINKSIFTNSGNSFPTCTTRRKWLRAKKRST